MFQPLYYFPSVYAFADLLQSSNHFFDIDLPFKRSSFRNRMIIAAADGPIQLSIPVVGGRSIRSIYREVHIDYKSHWQRDHFRTLSTAYGNSPFFMFYRDELENLYSETPPLLYKWNLMCLEWIFKKIKLDFKIDDRQFSHDDLRPSFRSDKYFPQNYNMLKAVLWVRYKQVFEEKIGFLPNLSILDLLFNEGPSSKQVLLNIQSKLSSISVV